MCRSDQLFSRWISHLTALVEYQRGRPFRIQRRACERISLGRAQLVAVEPEPHRSSLADSGPAMGAAVFLPPPALLSVRVRGRSMPGLVPTAIC